MTHKLKHAVLSLYAIATIQALTLIYSFYERAQLFRRAELIGETTLGGLHFFDFAVVIAVLMTLATVKCALELRAENPWAYAGAILIFILNLGGFGLPAGAYGLILLLHKDLRTPFVAKLQTAVDAL